MAISGTFFERQGLVLTCLRYEGREGDMMKWIAIWTIDEVSEGVQFRKGVGRRLRFCGLQTLRERSCSWAFGGAVKSIEKWVRRVVPICGMERGCIRAATGNVHRPLVR